MERIAVLDSGGQYCHLIARKVRELGAFAEIFPVGVDPGCLRDHAGIILSGGPSSVFDKTSPQPRTALFTLGKPLLGICYGHQLIARHLGGSVVRGDTHEFGRATLQVRVHGTLFEGLKTGQGVWMSHGDKVARPPKDFVILAETDGCAVAAMGHESLHIYGLQFHPEVVHTHNGSTMLGNFLRNACGCAMDWQPRDRIQALLRHIRETATDRRVLLFLSGGVDSTVAYALVVQALGRERIEAVYVDTGFMRDRETDEIERAFRDLDLGALRIFQASDLFMDRLQGVADPETKRAIIGQAFVDVQEHILDDDRYAGQDWVLGQGTIYPDTIESGGTHAAEVIKTHHNRVERIQELLDEGRVLEPLSEFYKDEVREIGRALGLPNSLLDRHPFPGPGLAIRCLCASAATLAVPDREISAVAQQAGYSAFRLPLHSVGVQGDSRSYAQLTVLHGGAIDFSRLLPLSTAITNEFRQTNRVVACLAPSAIDPSEWGIRPATLTQDRIKRLQSVDRVVTDHLRDEGLYDRIWQCPVVLLPWGQGDGETVALRPVVSVDGMTASVAELPTPGLLDLARRLTALDGVSAVVYDVSHKPPATIEWE